MDSKRSLSEISHLFLSDVRSRQTGGVRPNRIPPRQQADAETPEEFAASLETDPHPLEPAAEALPAAAEALPTTDSQAPRVSAILFSHLLEQRHQGVRQYARHLAAQIGNVGLIEVDSTEFGVSCFERNCSIAATPITLDPADTRQLGQTLAELAFNVNRWLISLPNPRSAEARELLRLSPHWVLLTTADDADVVATYRALKGLADLEMPRLSLVVLNARDDAQADAVFRKLDAVSRQFLGRALERESPVRPASNVMEHAVLNCRLNHEKPQPVPAPHWKVISQFVATAIELESKHNTEQMNPMNLNIAQEHRPAPVPIVPTPAAKMADSEVIDLPGDQTEQSILGAVAGQGARTADGSNAPFIRPCARRPSWPSAGIIA